MSALLQALVVEARITKLVRSVVEQIRSGKAKKRLNDVVPQELRRDDLLADEHVVDMMNGLWH